MKERQQDSGGRGDPNWSRRQQQVARTGASLRNSVVYFCCHVFVDVVHI